MPSPALEQLLRRALQEGYQIEPAAVALLANVAGDTDLDAVFQAVVRQKAGGTLLTKQDFEAMLGAEPSPSGLSMRGELAPVEIPPHVEVLQDPTGKLQPGEGVAAYHQLLLSRYRKLLRIAQQRPDGAQLQKLGHLPTTPRDRGQTFKAAGLVRQKRLRRTAVELTLDDDTGQLRILATDDATRRQAAELALDQLAIVEVAPTESGVAFARSLQHPDVPDRRPATASHAVYAVFISDLQVGSKYFLRDAFQRFLRWLQGRANDDYLVRRIKYLIVCGDLVAGIGVYPGQEQDLAANSIAAQMTQVAQLLEQVPRHIQILITPGNHDPTRQALPQPAIPRRYAEPLYDMENVRLLGNPALVKLHGVHTLLYHGQSLYDVVATTPGLTFDRPAESMRLLLRARHCAPLFGGRTPIAPEPEDHLVIDPVPDIFHTGHIHVVDAATYRGTLLLNSGTWEGQTQFQLNMGITPTPAIVPVVNLATLDALTKSFSQGSPAA